MKLKQHAKKSFLSVKRNWNLIFTVSLTLLLGGCGAKVNLSPEFADVEKKPLVFLPVKIEDGVMSERAAVVAQMVAREFQNKGYFLLDGYLVRTICEDDACSNKEKFVENYNAGGFIQLQLSSVTQRDFFAGFVNTIAGTLSVEDLEGRQVLSAENSQNQTGGLVFNSGQLIEGLESQYENYGDQGFARQASRFARGLLAEVPRNTATLPNIEPYTVSIAKVSTVELSGFATKVCVSGTPRTLAWLRIGRVESNLRETKKGEYCGIYRIPSNAENMISVELRSPFGSIAKQTIVTEQRSSCQLEGLVTLNKSVKGNELMISCVSFGKELAAENSCPVKRPPCTIERAIVYRADTEGGTYRKITELRKSNWLDNMSSTAKDADYQIIGISRDGILSQPVPAKVSTKDSEKNISSAAEKI